VGRLGRWRLLGWAAADGVRPWGKSRGYKHTSLNWAAKLRRHWLAASGAGLGEQGWAERRKRRVEGEGEGFAFFLKGINQLNSNLNSNSSNHKQCSSMNAIHTTFI
jgi:hypothetical protein